MATVSTLSSSDLITLLNSLDSGLSKNWKAVWQDEEQANQVQESIDALIYFTTLANPFNNPEDLEKFIGKLTISKIYLDSLKDMGQEEQDFINIGKALEGAIKLMLLEAPVIQSIKGILQRNTTSLEDLISEDADPAVACPLMMIISAMTIITDSFDGQDLCCGDEDEHEH